MAIIGFVSQLQAELRVMDDNDVTHHFNSPVSRIISLAPHATELLFAAGATNQIIGTVSFSDYPKAAKKIPRIGDYRKIDFEKLLSLNPELVIYWESGNPSEMIDEIKKLGVPVFNLEPEKFTDVSSALLRLGSLMGTENQARLQSDLFDASLAQLTHKYNQPDLSTVTVFYQVWDTPLMTINKQHIINGIIEFCGGKNIFADLSNIAPHVDIESILKKNPDTIITGITEGRDNWVKDWQQWQDLNAVKNQQVHGINADLIVRQTPRVLEGTEKMCEILRQVRNSS